MITIEEKADRYCNQFGYDYRVRNAYVEGATDQDPISRENQKKIDIKKACKAVCSFCQDKEQCYKDSWDTIENMRLAVSCEKIDKLIEAMEKN